MVWQPVNIKGQKFGKLTALETTGKKDKWNRIVWKCVCDCKDKKIKYASASDLRRGVVKSCGCLVRYNEKGYANFKRLLTDYKLGAKKRNLKWELTEDQTKTLFQGNCYYCGVPPQQICNFKGSNGKYTYNGIDRINNLKGYTLKNVVSCCRMCNRGKWNKTEQEFIEWINRVYNFYIKGNFHNGKITINIK